MRGNTVEPFTPWVLGTACVMILLLILVMPKSKSPVLEKDPVVDVIKLEPASVEYNLMYFSMRDVESGKEPEAFHKSLFQFMDKHPELRVRAVEVEKTHSVGINGYYVTFDKN